MHLDLLGLDIRKIRYSVAACSWSFFGHLLQLPRVLGGLVIVNIHEDRMEVVVLSGRAGLKVLH